MLTGAYGPGEVARTLNAVYGYRTRKTVEPRAERCSPARMPTSCLPIRSMPVTPGTWASFRQGTHPAMVTRGGVRAKVQDILKKSLVLPRPHPRVRLHGADALRRTAGLMITAELHLVKAAGGDEEAVPVLPLRRLQREPAPRRGYPSVWWKRPSSGSCSGLSA